MQDPTKAILTALYAALVNLALPVYTTLPLGVNEYVLLSQPTLVPGRGGVGCPAWDATVLLSVYTRFEQEGSVSFEPALAVSAEVFAQLVGQRLALPGFSTSPVELVSTGISQSSDGVGVFVTRTIRLRLTAYA